MGTTATTDADTATPVPAAGSCRVLGWKVFAPGFHKGRYYSDADCKRVVNNFQRLSTGTDPYLKAKAKLGHDDEQTVAMSLGFPNCGFITDCREAPGGGFEIDIGGVPLWIGAEINAGRINDGSVEFPPELSDPDDPSKQVAGPVLSGVAFLGDEQPAVKGCPPPKAVLDDGQPVDLAQAMSGTGNTGFKLAELLKAKGGDGGGAFSQGWARLRNGKSVATNRYRFSEMTPVNRDQILSELGKYMDVSDPSIANLPDDALAGMVQQFKGPQFAERMKGMFAAPAAGVPDPATGVASGDDKDDISTKFAAFSADCMKKFGAMDQAIGGVQDQVSKLQPGIQAAAAFSATYQARAKTDKQARAERVVTQASTEGRIEPKDKAIHLSHLMGLDDTVKFSATGVSERSPFELHSDDLLNRAVSPYFRETMVDADGEPGKATAYANRVMAQIPSARSLPAKKVA